MKFFKNIFLEFGGGQSVFLSPKMMLTEKVAT